MKKKRFLILLALGAMLTLASCDNGSSGSKKCNGGTCKIGYRYQQEEKPQDKYVIR